MSLAPRSLSFASSFSRSLCLSSSSPSLSLSHSFPLSHSFSSHAHGHGHGASSSPPLHDSHGKYIGKNPDDLTDDELPKDPDAPHKIFTPPYGTFPIKLVYAIVGGATTLITVSMVNQQSKGGYWFKKKE